MFVIGITGGIGCGKSTAADVCRQAGLSVIDADALSRAVTAADGAALPAINERFGSAVINQDGSLDRAAMARRVFKDHQALDALSHIVHRYVLEAMKTQVDELAKRNIRAVVLDVPIPVREGFIDLCDQIWVVWASDDHRLHRLAKRGMPEDEAKRRMAMQMTRDEYVELADHVLENDGTIEDLEDQVWELLQHELGQRGIRYSVPPEKDSGS